MVLLIVNCQDSSQIGELVDFGDSILESSNPLLLQETNVGELPLPFSPPDDSFEIIVRPVVYYFRAMLNTLASIFN